MEITLSKSQWEQIGETAGWIKEAGRSSRLAEEAFGRIQSGENKEAVLKSMGIHDPFTISLINQLLHDNVQVKNHDLPKAFQK